MASNTENTRAFLQKAFSHGEVFFDYLSDSVVWTVTGSGPLAGTHHGKQVYLSQVVESLQSRLENFPVPIIDRILADGDWGALYFHTENVQSKNGVDFSMQYCWIIKVDTQAGKIAEVIGFLDQGKLRNLFSAN